MSPPLFYVGRDKQCFPRGAVSEAGADSLLAGRGWIGWMIGVVEDQVAMVEAAGGDGGSEREQRPSRRHFT